MSLHARIPLAELIRFPYPLDAANVQVLLVGACWAAGISITRPVRMWRELVTGDLCIAPEEPHDVRASVVSEL